MIVDKIDAPRVERAAGGDDEHEGAARFDRRARGGNERLARGHAERTAHEGKILHGDDGGFAVDVTTGEVTLAIAPPVGAAVTAGFEFDVPVRFDTDALDVTLDFERLGTITSIPLIEVRR